MKELKCPHCGQTISVDEAGYAQLLNQVKNAEFQAELNNRLKELHHQHAAEQETAKLRAEQDVERRLQAKDAEISKRDVIIAKLQENANNAAQSTKMAVLEERQQLQSTLQSKEREIGDAKAELAKERTLALQKEAAMKENYEMQLRQAREEVERYKEFKLRLSTKMVGESLEQHCSNEFNRMRATAFPLAYFDKDNDASQGTKGDFIFRDYADRDDQEAGRDYISIMFEMKNETDSTSTKHHNEDFLAKLDRDRNDKRCEYAVLVSMLEPESELYNQGITDVSYRYPKMFVVRPQFFLTIISLLVQASRKSIDLQRALVKAQQTSVDLTNFESKINAFRSRFADHYERAIKKHDDAIEDIDKAIKMLQKTKDALQATQKYLTMANNDTDDLTIRRLTHGNPNVRRMIEEARDE